MKSLPPLPPSDGKSIVQNKEDSFYRVKSGDFWKHNTIQRIEYNEMPKCQHQFISVADGARCSSCNFILYGHIEVRSGKLFHEGRQIGL